MTGQKICNIPVVANYRSMYLYATRSVVDEIFIQTSCFEKYKMQEVITKFEEMGVKVNLSIDLLNLNVQASKQLGKIGAYYTVAFTGKEASLRMLFGKRLLDIIGGLVGVFMTGIITIILGPLIKLESPGPIFFSQKRVGKKWENF